MFEALGIMLKNNFYVGTQNGSRLEKCLSQIFDLHFLIKHPVCLPYATPTHYVMCNFGYLYHIIQ